MLCVEDYLDALKWAKSIGGLKALNARATPTPGDGQLGRQAPSIDPGQEWAIRSNTSVFLKFVDPAVT